MHSLNIDDVAITIARLQFPFSHRGNILKQNHFWFIQFIKLPVTNWHSVQPRSLIRLRNRVTGHMDPKIRNSYFYWRRGKSSSLSSSTSPTYISSVTVGQQGYNKKKRRKEAASFSSRLPNPFVK